MLNRSFIRRPFRYVFWNAALVIVGVNILVFLYLRIFPDEVRFLAMNPAFVVERGMLWQVFTYQFVHGNFSHLFFNMLGLVFFGIAVERRIGSREFILLYLLSGTLCGAFSLLIYVLTGAWYVFLMGASGAIFAVTLAYAVLYPDSVILIWGIIPVPAPILVIGYAAFEVFNLIFASSSGVAHATHLIGYAVAWAYCLVRFGINPWKVWKRRF